MRSTVVLSIILLLLSGMFFDVLAQTATAPAAGDGSSGSPYEIASLDNLYWISQNSSKWDSTFIQTADIDASDTENWDHGDDELGFIPIGEENSWFEGDYDGQGYKITGLYIDRSGVSNEEDYTALFGAISSTAVIENLHLRDAAITGTRYVGGLVGYTGSSGCTIESSSVTGSVTGSSNVGGIIGSNNCDITESYANVTVSGEADIGGFSGNIDGGTISNSYATGYVSGDDNIGGFSGSINNGTTQTSYASVKTVGNTDVGGFAGRNSGTTTNVYWNSGTGSPDNSIGSALSDSEMRTKNEFSGFDFTTPVWDIDEGTSFPYPSNNVPDPLPGTVITQLSPADEAEEISIQPTFSWSANASDSYDLQVSTTANFGSTVINESGITNSEHQISGNLDTAIEYFWRVRGVESGTPGDWADTLSFTTAYYENGSGTEADPYEIATAEDLDNMRHNLTAYYELTADIDLSFATGNSGGSLWNSGAGFEPIGGNFIGEGDDGGFQGSFDGQGFEISELHIDRSSDENVGLFYALGEDANINDINITDATVTGPERAGILAGYVGSDVDISNVSSSGTVNGDTEVGGLVGMNSDGSISNSSSSGIVNGNTKVGGLVGMNDGSISNSSSSADVAATGNNAGGLVGFNDGSINNSHATGTVSGIDYVGGLVGNNDSSISDSYATGTVNGNDLAGGLVGFHFGNIERCYALGDVDGNNYVGGLVGSNYHDGLSFILGISDSYAMGNVTGDDFLGGLVGNNLYKITDSYAAGEVSGDSNFEGGLVGINSGTNADIETSYWNTETSGQASGIGSDNNSQTASGRTSAEMRQQSEFIIFGTGFDFSGTWTIKEGLSFPFLQDNPQDPPPGYINPAQNTGEFSRAFDGNNDLLTVADSDDYDSFTEFTIELWIRFNNTGSRQGIIEKHESPDSGWWMDFNTDITALMITNDGIASVSSTTEPAADTWYHVAVVYDGGDWKMYINGIEEDSDPQTGTMTNNSNNIQIGELNWTSTPLDGNMDEIRIWNTARTEDQIHQNLFQPLEGDESGLVSYFPFFEGEGNGALDATGAANTAEAASGSNSPAWSSEIPPYGTVISGNEGWRVMASPVDGTSYGTLLDALWTQGFTGSDSPEIGDPNVFTWNESAGWTALTDAANVPDAGTGFLVYIYDDQDNDGTGDGFPKTIQVEDSQNEGSTSPTLSFTDNGTPADDGWNLVGNPYGTTIDWDATGWTTENLDATFYVWSDSADGGNGSYLAWNGDTGTLADGLIAPWQGFWVKANAADPSLTLTDEVRGAGGIFLKKQPVPELRFTVSDERFSNDAIVMLSIQSSIEKDPLDAYKLQSLNADYLSLFTQLNDGTALDINALPSVLEEPISIDLDFSRSPENSGTSAREFELGWRLESFPEDWQYSLRDNETRQEVDLREQSSYRFQLGKAKSSKVLKTLEDSNVPLPRHGVLTPKVIKAKSGTAPRFTLTIVPGNVVSNEPSNGLPSEFALQQNYPNPFNPSTVIRYQLPADSRVRLQVFDMLGREVAVLVDGERKTAGIHNITFDARRLASGVYIYRLVAGDNVFTKKLTLIK